MFEHPASKRRSEVPPISSAAFTFLVVRARTIGYNAVSVLAWALHLRRRLIDFHNE